MTDRLHKWRRIVLTLSLLVSYIFGTFAATSAEAGRVLSVCPRGCPYYSISAALRQAVYGDTIQVGPGIYLEHITMQPGVRIRGEGKNVSIITGADQGTVVRALGSGIDRSAILEGVTIIAGKAFTGGGIEIRNGASPTIRDNLITANTAGTSESYGGGIFISGGSPLISGNTFTKNYASWAGGAIAVWDESSAVITGNHFQDNKANQYGGAINVTRSSPTITGNTIVRNTAIYGAGIDMNISAPEFANNILMYNTANAHGGGAHLRNGSASSIYANTFMSNTAYYYGGGVFVDRSDAVISGNLFQYNDADSGGGAYIGRSEAFFTRNAVYNNLASFVGGGVHIHNSSPVLDNNNVVNNAATIGGAGLAIVGHSWPFVLNNTVANNAVGLYGGGVYVEGAAPSLSNNLVARNSSGNQGGGIFVRDASPHIQNNTVVYNNLAGNGEGIYLRGQSAPIITNNIIAYNNYGIAVEDLAAGSDQPIIVRNDVWDNRSGNITGIKAEQNISADPLFVRGRDGAFYLSQTSAGQSANSPALDAGTAPASDLGLDVRTTAVHDLPDTGMVDMGFHYRALLYKTYLPLIIGESP